MKLEAKDFKIETESDNFICIGRTSESCYDLSSILDLFEEMKKKGYEFIY